MDLNALKEKKWMIAGELVVKKVVEYRLLGLSLKTRSL